MSQRNKGPETKRFRTHASKRLRELRRESGVTQEDLARAMKRSRSSTSRLERGVLVMTFEDAFLATEKLDCSIYDLIDLEVKP